MLSLQKPTNDLGTGIVLKISTNNWHKYNDWNILAEKSVQKISKKK
jgi:hypothetical protein